MNNLRDYPALIAQAERVCLIQSQTCRSIAAAVESRKAEIESMVANDPTLTNDAKRKAMRQELMEEAILTQMTERLQAAQDKLNELRIEVNLLRDCFLVERLMMEDAIASKRVAA